MGRISFLKRVATNLLYNVIALVLLLLPTFVICALFWGRFTIEVILVDVIMEFIWLVQLSIMISDLYEDVEDC